MFTHQTRGELLSLTNLAKMEKVFIYIFIHISFLCCCLFKSLGIERRHKQKIIKYLFTVEKKYHQGTDVFDYNIFLKIKYKCNYSDTTYLLNMQLLVSCCMLFFFVFFEVNCL